MDLTEKILFYMKRYHMIPENKNIVVGLSGGADSVCLLYVLAALRKKLGLQLCAVHVHHGLRGVEADADEAYVRDICRAWDVPLKAMRIDAALLAPTAMNQQKFCFVLKGKRVSVKPGIGFYTKIDMGIAKYHFEIGTGKTRWKWSK